MKKIFFKATFTAICTLFILTSCLGDTDSSLSGENQLVYINYSETSGKYAFPITSRNAYAFQSNEALASLNVGDCAFVDYKFDPNNVNSEGIYQASSIKIYDDKIYRNDSQTKSTFLPFDTTKVASNMMPLKKLTFINFFPTEIAGDRWLVSYQYTKGKSDPSSVTPTLVVSYDEETQKDKYGKDLVEGERIVDFQLKKGSTAVDLSGTTETVTVTTIINASGLRGTFEDFATSISSSTNRATYIRLRYYLEKSTAPYSELNVTATYPSFYYFSE